MAERSGELNNLDKIKNEIVDSLEVSDSNRSLSQTKEFDAAEALAETEETDDAAQIREQIEETRSQMSETIDAIQEKLSVANITEQVKDQVSEQISGAVETAKDAFYGKTNELAKTVGKSFAQIGNSELAKKAQKNPWIFSVVGMSIGAILVGALSGGKPKRKTPHRYKNFDVPQTRQSFDASAKTDFDYEETENKSNEVLRPINSDTENRAGKEKTETSNSSFSGVRDAAGTVYESAGKAAAQTYQTIGKASGYAYEKAGDLGAVTVKNYNHYIEENPLAVGAVALAVGAAVGYLIPLTKTENQYFGDVRDKIFDKAQTSAQDAIDSFKQTVGDARQIIAEEVKSRTASK